MGAPEPHSPEDFAAVRAHPRFREAILAHTGANLAVYARMSTIERWLFSDLGRTALTSAVLFMDASFPGGATPAALMASAQQHKYSSRGRARLYYQRAVANRLMSPAAGEPPGPSTRLILSDGFIETSTIFLENQARAVSLVCPEAAHIADWMADPRFRQRVGGWLGVYSLMRPDLFVGVGMPIHLFQARDGGMRMIEALIRRQAPGQARLMETCAFSRSELARAGFCSRRHVQRLLIDAEDQGLLRVAGNQVTIAPELSDDVERHYALVYAVLRTGILAVIAAAAA